MAHHQQSDLFILLIFAYHGKDRVAAKSVKELKAKEVCPPRGMYLTKQSACSQCLF